MNLEVNVVYVCKEYGIAIDRIRFTQELFLDFLSVLTILNNCNKSWFKKPTEKASNQATNRNGFFVGDDFPFPGAKKTVA